MNKFWAFVIAVTICAFAGLSVINAGAFPSPTLESIGDGSFVESVEALLSENIPEKSTLRHIVRDFRYAFGRRRFDDIYIAKDKSLIRNIKAPDSRTVDDSVEHITDFIEGHNRRTYVMVIPTAAVIKQQEIPQYAAETLFNQRHMITDFFQKLTGYATTVDVYQTLFNHRNEYIYYNTEENLSGQGGYYIYEVLGPKMGLSVREASSYDIDYGAYGFYGALSNDFLCEHAEPDVVSMYKYTGYEGDYSLTHIAQNGEIKNLTGLYLDEEESLIDKTDMIFGGLSPIIHIETENAFSGKLLVFGDETAKSWLPFLVSHYSTVTYIDLNEATPSQLSNLNVEEYNQVLFGFGAGEFIKGAGLSNLKLIPESEEDK